MLVYTTRCGEEGAVEVQLDSTVDDLKTLESDAVWYAGEELPDGMPLCDTGIADGCVVDVMPWTPLNVDALPLRAEAPLVFPQLSVLTPTGALVCVSGDARDLEVVHPYQKCVGTLRPGVGPRVQVLKVCASERHVYVLNTSEVLCYPLPAAMAGGEPVGGGGDADAEAPRVFPLEDLECEHQRATPLAPLTLVYSPPGHECAGGWPGGDGGEPDHGVFYLSSRRGKYIQAKEVWSTRADPGTVLNLHVPPRRVIAWSGAPRRRVALVYDEGLEIYSLTHGSRVFFIATQHHPVGVAWFPSGTPRPSNRCLVAHKHGASVVDIHVWEDGDTPARGAVTEVKYSTDCGETPIAVTLAPTKMALASRYCVYIYG